MPPTCYLHVGTHKTGTTSLQVLLTSNEEVLARAGIHVPRAGRPWPPLCGHHNVAWELNDDPRFDPARGTLADVVAEIASVRAPTVCVSSEDFEYLHTRPDRLARLVTALRSTGYDVRVVVYLRAQAGYAESLYPTLLFHDLAPGFPEFLGTVLRDGAFAFRGWTFRFEYGVLLDAFAEAFGRDRIIARPYRPGALLDALPRGFMSIVAAGLPGFSFDGLVPVDRLNPRTEVEEAVNAGRPARGADLADTLPVIGFGTSLRIAGRFWRDNRRIRARYGVRVRCVER